MRTATTIEASAGKDAVEFAVEAERLGLDICWVAEAWGADAPSPLGYLAARTSAMLLGSGVIPVGHPLTRMRETVEIVRSVCAGQKVSFAGRHYRIPLGGSKPMRVSLPP